MPRLETILTIYALSGNIGHEWSGNIACENSALKNISLVVVPTATKDSKKFHEKFNGGTWTRYPAS